MAIEALAIPTLPAAAPALAQLRRSAPATRRTVWRVAIAEVDQESLELLRSAFGGQKVEIHEAPDEIELVELLSKEGPFDLVVTDLAVPWMRGIQVLRAARLAEIHTPVLVTTSFRVDYLPATISRLGNARVLEKPFGVAELREVIEDLLDQPRGVLTEVAG